MTVISSFRSNWHQYSLVLIGLILCSIMLLATSNYLMDDALITLRYSRNLGQIGSPVWNKADISNPTMGYTTPLWMLLNAIPAIFTDNGIILIFAARFFAFLSLLGIIILVSISVDGMKINYISKVAIVVGVFSQVGFAFHVNSAMETILFTFFVALTITTHLSSKNSILPAIFGILAFLTRPEGVLVLGIIILDRLRQRSFRNVIILIATSGVSGILLLISIYAYYGNFLPNSFYVKQESGISGAAVRQTILFIVTIALPYLLASMYSMVALRNYRSIIFSSVAFVLFCYYLTVEPLMNVLSRYQWPILMCLIYASLPTFEYLFTNIRHGLSRIAVAVILILIVGTSGGNFLGATYLSVTSGTAISNLIEIGKTLAPYREDEKWIVYHDAGAICYFSDWNCYDTIGLNTREVAIQQLSLEEILEFDNAYLVLQNSLLNVPVSDSRQVTLDRISQAGFMSVDTLVILQEDGVREVGVMFFSQQVNEVSEMVSRIQLNPDVRSTWVADIYALVRQIVKNR